MTSTRRKSKAWADVARHAAPFAAEKAMRSSAQHGGGRRVHARFYLFRPALALSRAALVVATIASMVLGVAPPASADVDLWGNNQRLRFYGTKLNGDLFDGRSLIGRPAVMWFWTPAPYCPVCIQEAPVIAAVAKAHPDVTFVGVAGRWDAMSMQRVVTDFGLDFTNLTDPNGMVWQAFIVPWPPAWAFLRPDGTGYLVNNVASPMTEQELTDRVLALTAPPSIMRIAQLAVTVLAAALAGSATPSQEAQADSPLAGTFLANTTPPSTWTIVSDCTVAANCVARVKSSDGWQSYASLSSGTWTLSVYRGTWSRSSYPANPQYCTTAGPGSRISQTFTFAAATLTGTVQTVVGDECTGSTKTEYSPFTLTTIDASRGRG